jgi:hypothetical protein
VEYTVCHIHHILEATSGLLCNVTDHLDQVVTGK